MVVEEVEVVMIEVDEDIVGTSMGAINSVEIVDIGSAVTIEVLGSIDVVIVNTSEVSTGLSSGSFVGTTATGGDAIIVIAGLDKVEYDDIDKLELVVYSGVLKT